MKPLSKTIALAAGVSLFSLAAQAASTPNDLYLGFNKTGASSDYLVDLGSASSVGVGGSSVVNLGSSLSSSLFNSVFGGSSGVNAGVAGGLYQFPSGDIFATASRAGGAGNASVAGSSLSGLSINSTQISQGVSALSGVGFPTAGNGLSDVSRTWSANVTTLSGNSFSGATGVDPSVAMNGSGATYLDLWKGTPGGFAYQGYFTLGIGASSLTFTPTAVPEPATVVLFCLGGMACFLFRRKLSFQPA